MTFDLALAEARRIAARTEADAAVIYMGRSYLAQPLDKANPDDVVVEVAAPKGEAR